jgi:hypothetical protein
MKKILAIQTVTKILSTLFDDQDFSWLFIDFVFNRFCKLGLNLRLIFPFA